MTSEPLAPVVVGPERKALAVRLPHGAVETVVRPLGRFAPPIARVVEAVGQRSVWPHRGQDGARYRMPTRLWPHRGLRAWCCH